MYEDPQDSPVMNLSPSIAPDQGLAFFITQVNSLYRSSSIWLTSRPKHAPRCLPLTREMEWSRPSSLRVPLQYAPAPEQVGQPSGHMIVGAAYAATSRKTMERSEPPSIMEFPRSMHRPWNQGSRNVSPMLSLAWRIWVTGTSRKAMGTT